ncbi:putative secreted protein (Por secretion system target) [Flavobacteriaceae bacterium MAR_2010_72]|nr:putative secreted protein (Por secretion system target) [Flavobacteriaceae bacterium MAR_2010_72]
MFTPNLTYLVMKKILLLICIIGWSYNSNAQCNSNLPVTETFDTNNIGVCWIVNDGDGDSNNWYWWEYSSYYGGHKVISSNSFYTSTGALNPDNWIMSHAIDLTTFTTGNTIELSWKVRGELAGFSHEYYSIYAATNNSISSFQSSPVKRSEYVDEVGGAGTFVTRTMDISSLAGNIVYIAFRHHNSTNQYNINIDDVTVSTSTLGVEDFNKDNFKYFYNSSNETLTLRSSNLPIDSVKIYNILGQSVINKRSSTTNEDIDMSQMVDGIYIAQIEINNSTKSIKFLKQ